MEHLLEETPKPRRRALAFLLTSLCFLLFGGICFLAGSLLIRQGQEVKISVETPGEEFTESVTFTVSNVLGIDILIDERRESCAMLQYNREGVWEDVCEIRFVRENSAVLSVKYGGMYAHLAPGMELKYCLDEKILSTMTSGEYRIAVSYISEEEYLEYLQERAAEIDAALAESSDEDESREETETDEESVEEVPETEEEEPSLQPQVQIFYKEFLFVGRQETSGYQSE
jgi:hypothetical protein